LCFIHRRSTDPAVKMADLTAEKNQPQAAVDLVEKTF
jgi:hypothetical protein